MTCISLPLLFTLSASPSPWLNNTAGLSSLPRDGWFALKSNANICKLLGWTLFPETGWTAGAAPPTLATQLNNGDILRAPARRPAAVPGSGRSSPPLPAASRLPPPHAPGGEPACLASESFPAAAAERRPAGPRARRAGEAPRGGADCCCGAAEREGKRKERKGRAGGWGRGRGPPPPRSASAGAPRAGLRPPAPGKAGRERARPPAARSKRQTTACYLTALPFYVIRRKKTGFATIKKEKSHAVHVTFWEYAGIEVMLNIERSSKKSSVWNHWEMLTSVRLAIHVS